MAQTTGLASYWAIQVANMDRVHRQVAKFQIQSFPMFVAWRHMPPAKTTDISEFALDFLFTHGNRQKVMGQAKLVFLFCVKFANVNSMDSVWNPNSGCLHAAEVEVICCGITSVSHLRFGFSSPFLWVPICKKKQRCFGKKLGANMVQICQTWGQCLDRAGKTRCLPMTWNCSSSFRRWNFLFKYEHTQHHNTLGLIQNDKTWI